jgi:hypothetical protein
MVPYLRGNVADAVNTTAAAAPYNYCNTLLYHWVRYAFQGQRGGQRWTIYQKSSRVNDFCGNVSVWRNTFAGLEYADSTAGDGSAKTTAVNSQEAIIGATSITDATFPIDSWNGGRIQQHRINPITQIEIPYMSNVRFTPGKVESLTGLEFFDGTWSMRLNTNGAANSRFELYHSTGEDFQVYMWTGLPRMYYEANPPAA